MTPEQRAEELDTQMLKVLAEAAQEVMGASYGEVLRRLATHHCSCGAVEKFAVEVESVEPWEPKSIGSPSKFELSVASLLRQAAAEAREACAQLVLELGETDPAKVAAAIRARA